MHDINIALYDSDPISEHVLKSILAKKNFNSIKTYETPESLLNVYNRDIGFDKPDIVIMDTSSKEELLTSIKVTEIIKDKNPKTIVICISSSKTEPSSIALKALASGCDSWVDKDKADYISRLMARIMHWVTYLEEKRNLANLYNNLAGISSDALIKE